MPRRFFNRCRRARAITFNGGCIQALEQQRALLSHGLKRVHGLRFRFAQGRNFGFQRTDVHSRRALHGREIEFRKVQFLQCALHCIVFGSGRGHKHRRLPRAGERFHGKARRFHLFHRTKGQKPTA